MALIKCKECANEVSDQAKACPKCGAPVKLDKVIPDKKKTSTFTKIIAVIFGIPVVVGIIAGAINDQEPKDSKTTSTPSDPKRDAQLQAAGAGAMILKKAMKDPTAFELTSLTVHANGTACYNYRAKNSYGAVLPSSAVLTPKGKMLTQEQNEDAFIKVWNKECTKADGDDITNLVKRLGII